MDLYWIDLETTGLNPEFDKILEIAIYKATLEDPFNLQSVYHKVINFNYENYSLDEFVKNMHTKNNLLNECLASKTHIESVQTDLLKLIPESEDKKNKPVLAGSTVHFDASFIKKYLPVVSSRFSHRHYDVSSIKLFCQSLGMPEFKKAEAHRAKDDILESAEHAKECVKWLDNR